MKKLTDFNKSRNKLNKLMQSHDEFFKEFGGLDDKVYSDGQIPKKYKELTGLSISIFSRCDECVMYHIQNCLNEKCTREEIVEAIKIGVIGGGSVTYPTARLAFYILGELKII